MDTVALPSANAQARPLAPRQPAAPDAGTEPGLRDLPLAARAATVSDRSFALVITGTALAIGAAFAIGRSGWFTPGDNVGYYIGLTGGVMMLLLLLYPLRKYVGALRSWGKVKYWFAAHMVLGVCGPILVLAHSTFHMHSTNAAVAQICMLVVAGSGIVGRFLYTKVHRGLYGEKMNLQELQARTGLESAQIGSHLQFSPAVQARLSEFQAFALAPATGLGQQAARLLGLGLRRFRVERACVRELRGALLDARRTRGWDRGKYRRRLRAATGLVRAYLGAAQRVAQFGVYDRLLQLWHVAHVPLVYLLVISAVAHVVAVHLY
jgi:hypothetical protein